MDILTSARPEDVGVRPQWVTGYVREMNRRRKMCPDITDENYDEIVTRMDRYMDEFESSGVDHLVLEE